MQDIILQYIREYAPYVVIAFNAIMSMLTYCRTGKIRKNTDNVEWIAEELSPVDSMQVDSDQSLVDLLGKWVSPDGIEEGFSLCADPVTLVRRDISMLLSDLDEVVKEIEVKK